MSLPYVLKAIAIFWSYSRSPYNFVQLATQLFADSTQKNFFVPFCENLYRNRYN